MMVAEKPKNIGSTINLSIPQSRVFQCNDRFRILAAGRRFGKTHLAIPELIRWAWGADKHAWYIAPTHRQAKMIAWEKLKKIAKPWIEKKDETDLFVTLCTGGTIRLQGAEAYDSLRGPGLDGVIFDEFADIHPKAWTEVVRPMLADRVGSALFIGTPKGFNHFKDMYDDASTKPGWRAFQFTTIAGGNVSAQEIEDSRRDMDPRTFAQEYEASFENVYAGRVYYAFDRIANVSPYADYDPTLPLCWSLDFNVEPMSSVICQISDSSSAWDKRSGLSFRELRVIDEIAITGNVNDACAAFVQRTEKWARGNRQMEVRIYGDPAGNSRSHAGPTSWGLVMDFFKNQVDFKISKHVRSADPGVKERVDATNAMLLNAAGFRRIFINPRCKGLIRDLEQVTWKADANGNVLTQIDKSNPKLSHSSDSLAYCVEFEFAIGKGVVGDRSQALF